MALKRNKRGSILLPNNKRITPSEQRALVSAVNSANRKRKRLIAKMPPSAKTKYEDFGYVSDFLYRKKSKSFSRFRNKSEFNTYLRSIKKLASGDFEKKRVAVYKQNYIQGLKKNFNSLAKPAIAAIRNMSNRDFQRMVESDELEQIDYVYLDFIKDRLTRINKQLGVASA